MREVQVATRQFTIGQLLLAVVFVALPLAPLRKVFTDFDIRNQSLVDLFCLGWLLSVPLLPYVMFAVACLSRSSPLPRRRLRLLLILWSALVLFGLIPIQILSLFFSLWLALVWVVLDGILLWVLCRQVAGIVPLRCPNCGDRTLKWDSKGTTQGDQRGGLDPYRCESCGQRAWRWPRGELELVEPSADLTVSGRGR